MNEKLMKMIARQAALVSKLSAGKITDKEKSELGILNKQLQLIADIDKSKIGKTKLSTMTLKEFRAHCQKEQEEGTAAFDGARLALLKRNIDSVKSQGKTKSDDVVAIEVLVEQSADDVRMSAIENQLTEVLSLLKGGATFDGRGRTGIVDNDDDGDDDGTGDAGGDAGGDDTGSGGTGDTAKGDMPITTKVAIEAITALISRYEKIKTKIENGEEFTSEELSKMWPNWELREAVESSVEVLAKLEVLKALAEVVNPQLEKLAKDEAGDGDGDGDDDGEGGGDDGGDGDGNTTKTQKQNISLAKFRSGGDLSAALELNDQFGACKKGRLS